MGVEGPDAETLVVLDVEGAGCGVGETTRDVEETGGSGEGEVGFRGGAGAGSGEGFGAADCVREVVRWGGTM